LYKNYFLLNILSADNVHSTQLILEFKQQKTLAIAGQKGEFGEKI